MRRKLTRWMWIEALKLDEHEREAGFPDGISSLPFFDLTDDFVPPETWDYADDQIPIWYEEWQEEESLKLKLARDKRGNKRGW